MEDGDSEKQLEGMMPQLVGYLCHNVDWLVGKVQELLPDMDLRPILQISDGKEKISVILQKLRKFHDAAWRNLINSICMECSLPMEIEVPLLSLMGEGSEMSWKGPFSNDDGKNRRMQEAATRYREQIRNSILEKYRFKDTGDPRGQCNPMFVEPLIKKVKLPKVKKRGKTDEAPEAEISSDTEKIGNLFKRTSLSKTHAILLIGMPGTGKTMMAHRICYQWAQGEYNQYALAFLFEFRQLNLIDKQCTLRELLFNLFLMPDLYLEEAYEFVIRYPQKVLIIFDGLDEFSDWPLDFQPSADHETSISHLFSCIVNGTILQGCTVIVTCRSKLMSSLPLNAISRVDEVLGFNKERVEPYVDNYFGENALKDKVLFYLRDNRQLLHLCFVPALCYIACVCLEHLSFMESRLPQTMTQFYLLQIFNKQTCMDEVSGFYTLSPLIFDLAHLAYDGLVNKAFFYAGEISEELKSFATTHKLLTPFEVKKFDGTSDVGYSFVHLSFQEFFAALYLIASQTITTKTLNKRFNLKSRWNLKGKKEELTDNVHIFLSGLSSKDCLPFLLKLSQESKTLIQRKQETILKSLERLSGTQLTGPHLIELCRCIYETQDVTLAKNSGMNLVGKYSITNFRISPADMAALVYVVNHGLCLVQLEFAGCAMELECLEVLGACDNVEGLSFRNKKYGEAFAQALSPVIAEMKHLKKIRLTAGRLSSSTIRSLKKSLLCCTSIQEINLQGNHLELEDMLSLLELFTSMKQLKLLDLSSNELSVAGVLALLKSAVTHDNIRDIQIIGGSGSPTIILCSENGASLSSPQIKRARNETTVTKGKSLSLIKCNLSCEDVTPLIAIIANLHLSDFNLSGNPIGDDGLKKLTDALPELDITGELNLSETLLSEDGVLLLVSCMQSCSHVKEVSVCPKQSAILCFVNNDDDGQRNIRITGFRYHQKGFLNLCSILAQCSQLTHLDLSDNNLGNASISQLTNILPYLKRLLSVNLSSNNISLGGILSMTKALSMIENLTDVNISFGNHQNATLLFQVGNREESSLNECRSSLPLNQLKTFSLTAFCMTYPKLKKILPLLKQCADLTQLDLSNDGLTHRMIDNVLKILPQLPNLTLLNISKSDLSPKCVLLLADSINQCPRITDVDVRSADHINLHLQQQHRADKVICRLNNCKIGKKDVAPLLKVMQKNPYLTEVSMGMNNISEDGILVLLAALNTTTSVSEITACLHPTETIHILFSHEGSTGTTIRLSGCNFQVEHVKKLCCVLQKSTTVSCLKLKQNSISPCVLKDVLQALIQMPHDSSLRIEEPWLEGERLISSSLLSIQDLAYVSAISVQKNTMTMEVKGCNKNHDGRAVSSFQGLNSLRFNHVEVGLNVVSCLWTNVKAQLSSLLQLDLSNNNLGDTGVQTVSDLMASLAFLVTIKLSCVDMSYIGVTSLAERLKHCKSVKNIDVSHNILDERGALSITDLLAHRGNLTSINVSGCFSATTNAGRRFIEELSTCLELQEICLQSMDLDDASLLTLAQGLAHMPSMRILMLGKSKITHTGIGHLAENLKHCHEMEVLDFSCNSIEDAGAHQLARLLPSLKKMRKINLSKCNIISLEGLTFIETLGQCQFLEEINFSENALEAAAGARLADVLPQLCHLKFLILKCCLLTDDICKSLANSVKSCQKLKQITLSWNSMGDEGSFELACALKHLGQLRILDLEKNEIGDQGAEAIAQALCICTRIKVVHLWGNPVSEKMRKKLKKQEPRMNFSFFQE